MVKSPRERSKQTIPLKKRWTARHLSPKLIRVIAKRCQESLQRNEDCKKTTLIKNFLKMVTIMALDNCQRPQVLNKAQNSCDKNSCKPLGWALSRKRNRPRGLYKRQPNSCQPSFAGPLLKYLLLNLLQRPAHKRTIQCNLLQRNLK